MSSPPPVLPDGEQLFRIGEAAELLRVSDKTIRRMIDSGQLPSRKLRGIHLIRWSNLKALLQTP